MLHFYFYFVGFTTVPIKEHEEIPHGIPRYMMQPILISALRAHLLKIDHLGRWMVQRPK